jgi:hypothetical protein
MTQQNPKEQADQQELRDRAEARGNLSRYAAQWDVDSAAQEIRLDRTAQAYEAGLLRPRTRRNG